MSKLKHTPGPWSYSRCGKHWNNPELVRIEINYGDDGECIADTVYQEDDARLIAAAPEMLEALIEDIKDDLANISCGYPGCECAYNKKDYLECDTLKKIKIIEKATGQKIEELI